jgi:hypothetical protein
MRPSILIVIFMIFAPISAPAEPASDAKMAREALIPYVANDPERRAQALNEYRRELLSLAERNPDAIRPARVFFAAGLSVAELQALSDTFGVEVMDVMVKAPQGTEDVVMSIEFGMADLLAVDGSLQERLSFAIAAEQKCFRKISELLPPDEAPAMADLAASPFLVYWARVFGPISSLRDLQREPNVTSVMLKVRPDLISEFEAAKVYDGPHRYFMPGFHC